MRREAGHICPAQLGKYLSPAALDQRREQRMGESGKRSTGAFREFDGVAILEKRRE